MPTIQSLRTANFASFRDEINWQQHASLNVLIGENDTGKTHLLKLLYAVSRAVEEHHNKVKIAPSDALEAILAKKLTWVFLPHKLELGALVNKGGSGKMRVKTTWSGSTAQSNASLKFEFGKDTKNTINGSTSENLAQLKNKKHTFFPAKEILSIKDAIKSTRSDSYELAVFDDTYKDLVSDYELPTIGGAIESNTRQALDHLQEVLGGGSVNLESSGAVVYKKGKDIFSIHQTAEGIKKIGVLSRLIYNRRIHAAAESVLFFDEPENNLHPKAILVFAEILHKLSISGIQIYLTTHSYTLLKRLEQISREYATDFALIDIRKNTDKTSILKVTQLSDGLTDNPIIEESIKLYEKELHLALGDKR